MGWELLSFLYLHLAVLLKDGRIGNSVGFEVRSGLNPGVVLLKISLSFTFLMVVVKIE